MLPEEIRKGIDNNYLKMNDISISTFVLDPEMAHIQREIDNLQAQCTHEFVNGICKWCDKSEE